MLESHDSLQYLAASRDRERVAELLLRTSKSKSWFTPQLGEVGSDQQSITVELKRSIPVKSPSRETAT